MKEKFTYKVVNKKGQLEPWTGVFKNFGAAQEWYLKHGKNWEAKGYKLVLTPNKKRTVSILHDKP